VPCGGLTLGRDGRFYGPIFNGGMNGYGAVFQMTPNGIVKILHEFTAEDDGFPFAPPIQSLYGDFYGTASGNPTHPGTIYKIDTDGGFTILHAFAGADGATPLATLVQATNYWFYGTTLLGGTSGVGTIFRISASGNFEVLFNFDGTHGSLPHAGLIQANDGNFYGVTYRGGKGNQGVVFRMTPMHQVTVLHDFTGGSDGSGPIGRLVQASDGYLYGTTYYGGASGGGILFRISTTGEFTTLHHFQQSAGSNPIALIQHTNGFLYGDTFSGGIANRGVFYRFDLGQPPFVSYLPSYGRIGMPVDILGEGFTTYSQVFFNGVLISVISIACARAGMGVSLWSFVAPHGALELPAIFIAGGAGLLMAKGLLAPGYLTRRESLTRAAALAIKLLLGAVPLLVIAGIIEGFISPSDLPVAAKFAIGASMFVLLAGYVTLADRRA